MGCDKTCSHVSQLVSVHGHARGPYWGRKKWNLLPDFAVYLNVTGKPAALAEVCVVHSSKIRSTEAFCNVYDVNNLWGCANRPLSPNSTFRDSISRSKKSLRYANGNVCHMQAEPGGQQSVQKSVANLGRS